MSGALIKNTVEMRGCLLVDHTYEEYSRNEGVFMSGFQC